MAQREGGSLVRVGVNYAAALKRSEPDTHGYGATKVVFDKATAIDPVIEELEQPHRIIAIPKTRKAAPIKKPLDDCAIIAVTKRLQKAYISQPKRASFRGLPVELRLRIYEHVTIPRTSALTQTFHCCGSEGDRVACSCAFADQKNTTAILAVNRQISQEAMPFFYRNLEVRLTGRDLPPQAAVHVRQIVVFAWDTLEESSTGPVKSSLYDGQWNTMTWTWPHLSRLYSNLEQVRIHYDTRDETPIELSTADADSLQGIVELPCLKKVIVQSHNRTDLTAPPNATTKRRAGIAGFLRCEAERKGRDVVVVEEGCGELAWGREMRPVESSKRDGGKTRVSRWGTDLECDLSEGEREVARPCSAALME